MKKFTKILICLFLCVMSVCLVACNSGSDKDKNFNYPPASGAVSGNGGLAVRKGNCLYFVNGYTMNFIGTMDFGMWILFVVMFKTMITLLEQRLVRYFKNQEKQNQCRNTS